MSTGEEALVKSLPEKKACPGHHRTCVTSAGSRDTVPQPGPSPAESYVLTVLEAARLRSGPNVVQFGEDAPPAWQTAAFLLSSHAFPWCEQVEGGLSLGYLLFVLFCY